MSVSGQRVFKGLNKQTKASFLLFLSELSDPTFDSITLEDPNWEDFTLNYDDGSKVICESKAYELNWSDVSDILKIINNRARNIHQEDEILIVCEKISENLKRAKKFSNYEEFRNHKFTEEQINLLEKTDFFEYQNEEKLYRCLYSQFQNQIYFWLKKSDIERFMNSILIEHLYKKSEKGAVFSKEDLTSEIEEYKREIIKDNPLYDPTEELESDLKNIYEGFENPDRRQDILTGEYISVITTEPQLAFALLDNFQKFREITLLELESLWKKLIDSPYTFWVLNLFEEEVSSQDEAEYVFDLLINNFEGLAHSLNSRERIQSKVLRTAISILENQPKIYEIRTFQ